MNTSQKQRKNSVTHQPKTGQEPAKNQPRTGPKQHQNSTTETVSMTLRMPVSLHTRARVHVAHTKVPLSALLRDLLTAHLDAQENSNTDA